MKNKLVIALLAAVFLIWSTFKPGGIVALIRENAWSLNLLKQVNHGISASALALPSGNLPDSAILLARQALKENNLPLANQIIQPLLAQPDRAILETYAEYLYANGQVPEAIKIWESLNDTLLLERAADPASQQGSPQNTLLAYQSLFKLDPEKYTSSLAFTLKSQGQLAEATELLRASMQQYPNSKYASDWLRYLADISVGQQDWQQAELTYRQVVNENPSNQTAWRNLGLLYLSQAVNKPLLAVECFQQLVKLSPEEPSGYRYLAQAYELAGDPQKALLTYQNLLLVAPDDPTALQAVQRLSTPISPAP